MFAGPSPGEIKNQRQYMGLSCTTCFKAGKDFKRCERCKTAYYCSKDCQKANWPRHKQFCKPTEGSGMTKFLENLIGNKLLNLYLQIILILEFDIHNNPQSIREPFMARIDVVMEPVKLEDLRSLLKLADAPETIEGMLQLTNIISPRSGGSNIPLTPMRQNMWETARRELDAGGNPNSPVGLVEFVNNSAGSITAPVYISPQAIGVVRQNLPALIPAAAKSIIPKSMSVYTSMEFINANIRFDTENRWLLRKSMGDSDKQIIRDVGNHRETFPAIYFKGKMERESIYTQQ